MARKFWMLIANFTMFLLKAGEEVLVGGQAVFEGVMMRTPKSYSIAVRRPDGSVAVKKEHVGRPSERNKVWGFPVFRGMATLGQAFTLGLRALKFSTDQVLGAPEEDGSGARKELSPWVMALNILFALVCFVLLFKFLPLLIASWVKDHIPALNNQFTFSMVDGIVRLLIFLVYLFSISLIKDIRRVFEYHGAEHKVVFTYEAREALSVRNAQKYSTLHPRCGTSFLMVVMLISILVYALIPFDTFLLKLLSRIVLIPVIAGISYEIIRFAARSGNRAFRLLTAPGLWLQRVTTKEPGDDQLEIAVQALNEALALE